MNSEEMDIDGWEGMRPVGSEIIIDGYTSSEALIEYLKNPNRYRLHDDQIQDALEEAKRREISKDQWNVE
jgi:hypothetical protein